MVSTHRETRPAVSTHANRRRLFLAPDHRPPLAGRFRLASPGTATVLAVLVLMLLVKRGKATTPVVPLAGTVTFTSGSEKVSISVGNSGTFSARLPPGTYAVSGVSGGQACSVPRGCRPGRHPGSWFSASPSDLSWLTIAGSSSFPVSAQLPHIPVRVTTGDYIRRLLAINPVRQSTATPRNLGKCRASSGARHNEGRLLRRRGAAQRSAPITVGTEGLPQRSRMSWQRGDRMATGDT